MKPSPELIRETIVTFSPRYQRQISTSEAEEIVNNVCNLLDVLEEPNRKCGKNGECCRRDNFEM